MNAPYTIASMTPEQQIDYANQMLAVVEQRLSEVSDPEVKLHLADSKAHFIATLQAGKKRLISK